MSDPDYESLSRGISSDMSPESIARRLEIASQLYRLAQNLGRAVYVGPVEPGLPLDPQVHEQDPGFRARDQ